MPNHRAQMHIGSQWGRLTIVREAGPDRDGKIQWACRCECGNEVTITGGNIRRTIRPARSCGCLKIERIKAANTKHGFATDVKHLPRAYASWKGAKERCYNPNYHHYADWGGRGIYMVDQWRNDFGRFLRDMGERPPQTTLDRIDNDGPYAPWNCRWADHHTQRLNRHRQHPRSSHEAH